MTTVKRFCWLLVALGLCVVGVLGLFCVLTSAAPPDGQAANLPAAPQAVSYTLTISETWVTEPISDVQLYTRILQPDPHLYPGRQFPAVVLVPGGLGAGAPQINLPTYQALAEQGFIVVGFNAPGRGTGQPGNLISGGSEDCNGFAGQNALKAVIEYAATLSNVDTTNIGVQTSSYGITMGAGALGRYPDLPVQYLVDIEGPSNNLISTFYYSGHERNHLCGHWSVLSDTSQANLDWWLEREAYRYIGDFPGYYLRAQGEIDHAQPPGIYTHTLEMNDAAVAGGVGWVRVNGMEMGNPISVTYGSTLPVFVPGSLRDYPNLTANYVIDMANRFGATITPTWQATFTVPHDVDRLDDGTTLITAGDAQQSRLVEVDAAGNVVALYIGSLNFAHNGDRLSGGHTLLSDTGNDRVVELDELNVTIWSSEWITLGDGSTLNYPNDANWLAGDHLLITDRDNHRVIEIDRDGNVVWQFGETGVSGSDDTHLNGPHNADRLDNGNTLIADSNNRRVLEVTPAGAIVWSYAPAVPDGLAWPRDADRLDNGNTLITDSNNDRIVEVTPAGAVVWEYAGLDLPYDADRLSNGNTLIANSGNGRVIEVDVGGNIVWQVPATNPSDPPILISIVMHNEEPLSGQYPDFVNDEAAFWEHREALVPFVDMLHDNGVMFNYQSDWNFLMAAGLYDTGTPETNGQNVVRYVKDLGFEVDPHAHESQYTYADVAYLIDALGVTPSHVAGGFLAAPPEVSKLQYLWQPISATLSPTYTWQAEILWGAATYLHQNEESLWASGIWKPGDVEHFLTHDDGAPLPYVGGYGRDNCELLLQMQRNGELEEGAIHTCTLFVGQNELLRPNFLQQFEQEIQALDAAGNVRWVGLAEAVAIWETEYGAQPHILPYLEPAGDAADSPFGFHPASVHEPGYADNGFTDAQNVGVRWTREGVYAFWFIVQPDLGDPTYDFSLYDLQWGSVPADIHILGNIAPQSHTDEGRCLPGSWLPVSPTLYTAFVTATVERYDGDGVEDVPGLTNPIRYWQVGNEPDHQVRTGFAGLQLMTYHAIKQACPDCTVLIGGATGFPEDYIAGFDVQYAPILAELNGQGLDVFDFHWYGDAEGDYRLADAVTGEDVLDHIRTTLTNSGFSSTLPIWITEMGSYSGDPAGPRFAPQTERQQAGDIFRRFIYPLSRGMERIFPAFGLMEGFKHDDGYFDHTGLIYDGEDSGDLGLGIRKLSYYTYRKMTEELAGADWDTLTLLHDGTDGDHIYLFRVERAGRPAHIAWWDTFDELGYTPGDTVTVTLSGLTATAVSVTSVVPDAETGQEVTDYATAFPVTTYFVSDGCVTISLGEDPVLVEEASSAYLPLVTRTGP